MLTESKWRVCTKCGRTDKSDKRQHYTGTYKTMRCADCVGLCRLCCPTNHQTK